MKFEKNEASGSGALNTKDLSAAEDSKTKKTFHGKRLIVMPFIALTRPGD